MSSKTKRQLFVEAVKTRLARISVANGYQTELGARPILEWPIAFQEEDLPALGVYDLVEKSEKHQPDSKAVLVTLPMQVRIFLKREPTPATVRNMLADVMRAVSIDPVTGERDYTFGGLAWDTKPDEDGFIVPKDTFQIDGAAVGFHIEYLTEPFNAYQ